MQTVPVEHSRVPKPHAVQTNAPKSSGKTIMNREEKKGKHRPH